MPYKNYFAFLLLTTSVGFSQINTKTLIQKDIPKSITYKGKIVNALHFSDISGDNMVIISETDKYNNSDADEKSMDIFAYSYIVKDGIWELSWKVYDFEKDCPFDLELKFLEKLVVTDLDDDNNAEVWIIYEIGCRSDVTPLTHKIIMYENGKKYAIRGNDKSLVGNGQYSGGDYTFDYAFKQSPKEFRDYAIKLWNRNLSIKKQ